MSTTPQLINAKFVTDIDNAVPALQTIVRTRRTELSQKILLFNNCVTISFTPLLFTGSLITSLFSTFLPKTPDMRSATPGTRKNTQSFLTTATKIFALIYINATQ